MASKAVKDLPLEELFTHAENVQALLAHPGWEFLQSIVMAEIAEISRYLDGDRDISHVEYARKHGRIGGLKEVHRLAVETVAFADKRYAEQQAKHEGSRESELVGS